MYEDKENHCLSSCAPLYHIFTAELHPISDTIWVAPDTRSLYHELRNNGAFMLCSDCIFDILTVMVSKGMDASSALSSSITENSVTSAFN